MKQTRFTPEPALKYIRGSLRMAFTSCRGVMALNSPLVVYRARHPHGSSRSDWWCKSPLWVPLGSAHRRLSSHVIEDRLVLNSPSVVNRAGLRQRRVFFSRHRCV